MRDPDRQDRELVQAVERHQQHQHRHHVRRRQHRRDRRRPDDRVATRPCQLLAGDDPGPLEDHQQDGQQESRAEAEQEARHESQVITDRGQGLLTDTPDVALVAEQELQRPWHGNEVSERCAPREEQRCGEQERQEGVLLFCIEARRDESPQLRRKDGEAQHQCRE
jgi:hypothetical protein